MCQANGSIRRSIDELDKQTTAKIDAWRSTPVCYAIFVHHEYQNVQYCSMYFRWPVIENIEVKLINFIEEQKIIKYHIHNYINIKQCKRFADKLALL